LLAGSLVLAGCGEKEPEPVATKTEKAPPPPPPPPKKTVADLMAELNIDDRIVMDDDVAPSDTEDAKAVLRFFDAFASGDADAVESMIAPEDRAALEAMLESGQWASTTGDMIDRIEIRTSRSFEGQCALALFEIDFEEQPQLWYYKMEGGEYTFRAAPTPPNILQKLSGVDWIESWHEVLEQELALASKPDDEYTIEQVNLETDSSGGGRLSSPGGSPGRGLPSRPSGPGLTPPGPTDPGETPGGG